MVITHHRLGKTYAGVNPNRQSWQLLLGSTAYPQQPVKCTKVSECFYQNQKSYGSLYSTGHCGSANYRTFAKASTVGGGFGATGQYHAFTTKPADRAGYINSVENANKWYQALDLEVINQLKDTLFTGISTKGSTNILRLNIGQTLAATPHNIHMFSYFDVIMKFDYANGVIETVF